jgi:hypothetical protein
VNPAAQADARRATRHLRNSRAHRRSRHACTPDARRRSRYLRHPARAPQPRNTGLLGRQTAPSKSRWCSGSPSHRPGTVVLTSLRTPRPPRWVMSPRQGSPTTAQALPDKVLRQLLRTHEMASAGPSRLRGMVEDGRDPPPTSRLGAPSAQGSGLDRAPTAYPRRRAPLAAGPPRQSPLRRTRGECVRTSAPGTLQLGPVITPQGGSDARESQ